MTEDTTITLPKGRQFAVTWGITQEFGGMTSAMLRRSRAFVRLAGTPVELLTFDARDDYDDVAAALRADGRLIDGMTIRNLWDDLTDGRLPGAMTGAKTKALEAFAPLGYAGDRTRRRLSDDGEILQLDRHRADGSLAISDRRDVTDPGRPGGRSIVLCDAQGRPVHGFTGARAFYRAWLDAVLGDDEAFLLVDSKTAAPTIAGYTNPRATTIHVVHNSHLAAERRPFDEVKPSRREALAQIEAFDGVVVLSERQREDFELMFSLGERTQVVPNSAPLPEAAAPEARDRRRGVILGSLDARKRVEHAVSAIERARSRGVDVRLDVFGDGPARGALEKQITRSGLEDAVTLHGFQTGALENFTDASFFLLTSVTEGFPLVLAEGMSRGCIPVSYDIPYGPADIIEDGVSGFLVPPGDEEAIADRLVELAAATDERIAALRRAATVAAHAFTDEAVTRRWADVLNAAQSRRRTGPKLTVSVVKAAFARSGGQRSVVADFRLSGADVAPADLDAAIAVHGVARDIELRLPCQIRRTLRHGVWRATATLPSGMDPVLEDDDRLTGHLGIRAAGGYGRGAFPTA